jgi:two-component system, response regulator YesN
VADFIASIQTRQQEHSNQKVAAILQFLSTHYRQKITLKRVAQEVGLSTFRPSHLVKEVMHKPLFQIVQEVRMQKAQDLLWKTSKSCTEIAYEVGYQEQSYFIKHFKRHTGVTPTRFRRRGLPEMAPVRGSQENPLQRRGGRPPRRTDGEGSI